MPTIKHITGLEILDSRGRPTLQATCALASGAVGTASVPSGASTGTAEALELRDGDPKRYRGLGCLKALGHIRHDLHDALRSRSFDQRTLDQTMLDLDGTPTKARLGANALLAVSIAFARAAAAENGQPLYQYFADFIGQPVRTLPRLTVNLFSGGKHAGAQVPIQDVLIVPLAARTIDESLAVMFDIYYAAADLIQQKYQMRLLRADEGGQAPPFDSAEAMIAEAVESIRATGRQPGKDASIAIDVASTHFYREGKYFPGSVALDSQGMIAHLRGWLERYPIISIEDGLSEEDWAAWTELRATVDAGIQILGDDFLCTNPARIRRAIETKAANALLLKVNQIGTLTEAAEACQLARAAGWKVVVSARSGETEDDWLADLAVGWGGDQIKIGSITQSERLAKYNRLLAIEATTGLPLA